MLLLADGDARSTLGNARAVAAAARETGADARVTVVTSSWHRVRARALVRAALDPGVGSRVVSPPRDAGRSISLGRELACLVAPAAAVRAVSADDRRALHRGVGEHVGLVAARARELRDDRSFRPGPDQCSVSGGIVCCSPGPSYAPPARRPTGHQPPPAPERLLLPGRAVERRMAVLRARLAR